MKFAFISEKTGHFPVAWMCRRLGVSRAGFYAWRTREPSERSKRDAYLTLRIKALFKQYRGLYGSPRICSELKKEKESVGRNRVIRLMQENDLCARRPEAFRRTTDSNHGMAVAENVVARQFNPDRPNVLWASDITYIRTWEGFLYLAVVIDLFSRRVVGWAVAAHMRAELTTEALHMALRRRQPAPGLVHHSDRGSQYASSVYQKLLDDNGMICSMSRKGNCWDNAVVESSFGSLKNELIYRQSWPNMSKTSQAIKEYIECFYNTERAHSTLGYLSPMEYETCHMRSETQHAV